MTDFDIIKSYAVEWLYDAASAVKGTAGRLTPALVCLFTLAVLVYMASPLERSLALAALVSGVLAVADVTAFRYGPPPGPA